MIVPIPDPNEREAKATKPLAWYKRLTDRLDSTTKTLLAIGGLLASITGLWGAIMHFVPSSDQNSSKIVNGKTAPQKGVAGAQVPTQEDIARYVTDCETQHKMSAERQIDGLESSTATFKACEWPPSSISDADGYSEIILNSTQGPGDSEASGTDSADRITGPCRTFRLSYDYGHMGDSRHLKDFDATPGDVMIVSYFGGEPWSGDRSTIPFYPLRNEVVVLRSGNYGIANIQCV
jgi:hypothetical protein